MAKEQKISFMVEEEMADWIAKTAFHLDTDKSKLLRAAILIGLPAVKEMAQTCLKLNYGDRKPE